jgi:DNA-binding MarR family transcriptional regulator
MKMVDGLLKNLLILSRTVDHVLEDEAVKAAVSERLSESKVHILRLLGTRGSQTSSQIARFLGVSKPAVTQLVDSMVRRKLVVRKTAKHDRREVDLQLTAKGKATFEAVRSEQRQVLKRASKQASAAESNRWVEVLGSITEALAMAGDAFEHFCLQCGAHADGSCVLEAGGRKSTCAFLEKARAEGKA